MQTPDGRELLFAINHRYRSVCLWPLCSSTGSVVGSIVASGWTTRRCTTTTPSNCPPTLTTASGISSPSTWRKASGHTPVVRIHTPILPTHFTSAEKRFTTYSILLCPALCSQFWRYWRSGFHRRREKRLRWGCRCFLRSPCLCCWLLKKSPQRLKLFHLLVRLNHWQVKITHTMMSSSDLFLLPFLRS